MRIGVLGGTFDPIHVGHLVAAEQVAWALALDRVLFVPAGTPPHKAGGAAAGAVDRVRMVELAIAGNPLFELSLVDVNRPGRSYTVDTLRVLRMELGESTELHFIVGMDSLGDLAGWKDPVGLIAQCRLAVVNRPPYPEPNLARMEEQVPGISERVDMVNMPGIALSSSDLRRMVASGAPIRYLVPDAVEQYIIDRGLYRP